MPRPKIRRRIRCTPICCCYKPEVDTSDFVMVERDEYQAIKLKDVDGLDQIQASKMMNVSQPTFARILNQARKKISKAIIGGEEIRIN